jgi:c-di-GMP-binding flagellar brake protein YcgR
MEAEVTVAGGRKSARVKLVVPCEIKGSKDEAIKVPVSDISLDGIRLVSTEPHLIGDILRVTLRLPTRIELPAEIRWIKTDETKNRSTLGCRFAHEGDSRQTLKATLINMASAIDSAARRVK